MVKKVFSVDWRIKKKNFTKLFDERGEAVKFARMKNKTTGQSLVLKTHNITPKGGKVVSRRTIK